MIVEENRRRERAGGKAAWLCYDQVYWQLLAPGVKHATPPEVCPDVAPYTIILDAASKSFAATGLRVGWAVMPPAARQRMADILGHVGRVGAAAGAGGDGGAARRRRRRSPRTSARCAARVQQRLDRLAAGFAAMRADGYPVEAIAPQGAIYLSVRVAIPGQTNEATRQLLLDEGRARAGAVPGVRPARGQRLVPHLGRRGVARRDRRRASRACGPRCRGAERRCRAPPPPRSASRSSLRLALFPFAENKHGDAPMRALVAERMVLDPASAAVPAHVLPVRTAAHDADAAVHRAGSAGAAIVALPVAARRDRGAVPVPGVRAPAGGRSAGAELATFALALSPLHLQASTTAASEALYLLLWVCALERLLAALDVAGACGPSRSPGLLASLAAVTRYDAWLALPITVLAALCSPARGPARDRCRGPGGVLAVRGVAADRVAGVGRARGRRSAVLRALHHDATTPGWPRTSPAGSARCSVARASSGSGRWRSSRR